MSFPGILSTANRFLLDTIFPIECVQCREEGAWLCPKCTAAIPLKARETCFVCKEPSRGWRTCYSCRSLCALGGVIGFFEYSDEVVKTALQVAKYGFVKDILTPLLSVLAPYVNPAIEALDIDPRAVVFIPIPLHPRRRRERGFNQAEIIANAFAQVSGGTVNDVLVRRNARPPQASLDAADRAINIKKAFICKDPTRVRGRWVFLVDDIATTGSTLDESGRLLRAAGALDVWGIVLARG